MNKLTSRTSSWSGAASAAIFVLGLPNSWGLWNAIGWSVELYLIAWLDDCTK